MDRVYEFEWQEEVQAGHRWGAHGVGAGLHSPGHAETELQRLQELHEDARPLNANQQRIVSQIVSLEICNWRLEPSLVALCDAIGSGEPVSCGVGHSDSVTAERWNRVQAYALALRAWQAQNEDGRTSARAALTELDPTGEVERHVRGMLGEPDELKRLRVALFGTNLQFWLNGRPGHDSATFLALKAAHDRLKKKLRDIAPDATFNDALFPRVRLADDGQLHPCHHKLFRRYDIIISSIGHGTWRGAMPYRGTDGEKRAQLLDKYLSPIEAWVQDEEPDGPDEALSEEIFNLLGTPTPAGRFQAALLASLLRAQQDVARIWAERARAMHERDERDAAAE